MSGQEFEAFPVLDVRAQCPKCGRFVAWSALDGEDHIDPTAYYGISTDEWTNCPHCGRIDGHSVTVTKILR